MRNNDSEYFTSNNMVAKQMIVCDFKLDIIIYNCKKIKTFDLTAAK